MIPLRLYAYAAVVLAFAGVLAHDKHLANVIKRERAAAAAAQAQADLQIARQHMRAEIAEETGNRERQENADYRKRNPLHGRLCPQADVSLPAAGTDPSNAGPGTAPGAVLPLPPRDRQRPDQLGMLDVLAGKADDVSAALREYQGR